MRTVFTRMLLLWSIRSFVSSRAEYNAPDLSWLAFEDINLFWTGETMVHFLSRRQSNYEPLDATSKVQDRLFEKAPKQKTFMIAVLMGIFCSLTIAEIVEEHLDEVLATRTLKHAVEAVANHARQANQNSSVARPEQRK